MKRLRRFTKILLKSAVINLARKNEKCYECEFHNGACIEPTATCVNHSNFKQKQNECLAGKVTTHKLTPEEIELMTSGKKTYEEIIADKKPMELEADLSSLTKESYSALKHEGLNDFEIRRRYGIKPAELDELKRNWFKENQFHIVTNKSFEKKRVDLKTEKEATPMTTTLTKELLIKHTNEGMLNKEIMKMYRLDKNQFYKLKREWGLTNGVGRPSKPSVAHQDAPQKNSSEKKTIHIDAYNKLLEDFKVVRSRANKLDDIVIKKDQELKEANDLINRLQKLRSEDVALIDRLNSNVENHKNNTEQVEYKEPENNMFTEDQYRELENENIELKQAVEQLKHQGLRYLSQISRANRENEALSERVENLLHFEEKYFATSKALKLHLQ